MTLLLSDLTTPQSMKSGSHKVVLAGGASATEADDQGKYRARAHPLKRALQKLLPSLFAPTLPVTAK